MARRSPSARLYSAGPRPPPWPPQGGGAARGRVRRGEDAGRHEMAPRRDGAPLSQRQIVLGGPALVAVAFDGDGPRRVALQQRGVFVEDFLNRGAESALCEREEHRLEG